MSRRGRALSSRFARSAGGMATRLTEGSNPPWNAAAAGRFYRYMRVTPMARPSLVAGGEGGAAWNFELAAISFEFGHDIGGKEVKMMGIASPARNLRAFRRRRTGRLLFSKRDGCRSFVAEGCQRIDLHGATRRKKSSEGADGEDSDEHPGVVGEVGGLDAAEEVSEQWRKRKTQQKPCEEAGKDPGEPVSQDHAQDPGARRANGDANANFWRALCDGVREDPIDAAAWRGARRNGFRRGRDPRGPASARRG